MKRRVFVAGLVSTVPCGAAFAHASSAQCALNEREADIPAPAVPDYAPDQYLRLPCVARRWWDAQEAREVISYEVEGLEYLDDGSPFAPVGLQPLTWPTGELTQPALCLGVYDAGEAAVELVQVGMWPREQFSGTRTPITQSCYASFV